MSDVLSQLDAAERSARSGGQFVITLDQFRALIDIAKALRKARSEEYCNVPCYVDEALAKLSEKCGTIGSITT